VKLPLEGGFFVSDIEPGDKAAYLEHLQEKEIYDRTLAIPYPYTEEAADWWIQHVAEETKAQGRSVNWAIRRSDGYLIGGIGHHELVVGKTHKAEIGYWLAKPYWGRGIMTDAVRRVSDFSFRELQLIRLTAHVFAFNTASARVLEKAGYQLEGRLRLHYKKNGRLGDGLLYAKLADTAGRSNIS
jgi:ribosomal-protein-alanine N-acetyltransferase